jgi:hypothetical protein
MINHSLPQHLNGMRKSHGIGFGVNKINIIVSRLLEPRYIYNYKY